MALSERLNVGASLFAGAERTRFELSPGATAERVSQIEDDLSTYGGLAQVVAVVAALALMAPSLAPLLIGLHFGSRYPETSQTAT